MLYGSRIILHAFYYKQRFYSTQPQSCCLTFSWIELQILLGCCLTLVAIIILKHILYSVYLRSCLGLGLFMSHLCDLFFIFSLIFIVINHITSLKQTHLFFENFLEYLLLVLDNKVDKKGNNFQIAKGQPQGVA